MYSYQSTRYSIHKQALSFRTYIDALFKSYGASELLRYITSKTDIYIFSGVIRNFLLGYLENRDIDFVIKEPIKIPQVLLKKFKISINKLGGLKIYTSGVTIDVWELNKTWGLLHKRNHRKSYKR